mgnify:CR=1 FL=1
MILEEASFQRRLNRFVIEARLDRKPIRAYLPNPGRLWEFLIPGRIVYLKKEKREGLPYTVWATERKGSIICLHTQYTNNVAERLIMDGVIEAFRGFTIVKKEFSINHHRVDFLIKNGRIIIPLEVKSCTLFEDTIAMFPDAVTERGRQHLEVLGRLGGAVLFIVHYPGAEYFLPDFHTDPLFSETLYKLKDKIIIKAISVMWDKEMNFRFVRELSIPWHIYEKEAGDRGAYIITGLLKRNRTVEIGSLGRISFKKGYYLYIGSAMNSLSSRIKRHMRKEKTMRWHIDYLIPYLQDIRAIPIQSSEDLECHLAQEIESITVDYIKAFGSSDCNCKSHLYWMKDNPFSYQRFIDILLKYRIGRLMAILGE